LPPRFRIVGRHVSAQRREVRAAEANDDLAVEGARRTADDRPVLGIDGLGAPGEILEAWYPGVEGGTAIARTLAGLNNPAGRLPVTFYASLDGLPAFTDYAFKSGGKGRTYRYFPGKPLWGFGYGLSYSIFKYGPVKVSSDTVKAGDPITATVSVSNISNISGDEVVEVYLTTPQKDGPIQSLVGFQRVEIGAGATREVTIPIDPRSLSSVDDRGNRTILEGKYTLSVGAAQPQETQSKSEAAFTVTGSLPLPK
jgi:beta-glucosidase